jgi:hypothetical protein
MTGYLNFHSIAVQKDQGHDSIKIDLIDPKITPLIQKVYNFSYYFFRVATLFLVYKMITSQIALNLYNQFKLGQTPWTKIFGIGAIHVLCIRYILKPIKKEIDLYMQKQIVRAHVDLQIKKILNNDSVLAFQDANDSAKCRISILHAIGQDPKIMEQLDKIYFESTTAKLAPRDGLHKPNRKNSFEVAALPLGKRNIRDASNELTAFLKGL